jgi:molybdopterin biosynthesis enzyme
VESACAIAKKAYPVLSVKPYKPLATGIILTGSEVLSGRVKDRFEPILRDKVKEYGSRVLGVKMRGDSKDAIADAIHELICEGAALVLLAGGMSVDPDDATEAAMKAACGNLVFSGVPMQPGNMLALGCIGSAAVVGVPGASLVHAKTSLDVFLPRIFAGAEITKDDAARLGEGGLL